MFCCSDSLLSGVDVGECKHWRHDCCGSRRFSNVCDSGGGLNVCDGAAVFVGGGGGGGT